MVFSVNYNCVLCITVVVYWHGGQLGLFDCFYLCWLMCVHVILEYCRAGEVWGAWLGLEVEVEGRNRGEGRGGDVEWCGR
jgi:hypothetical protein